VEVAVVDGEQARGPVVLIADDDESFVAFVQRLLHGAGYRTLTATTGMEALEVAREHAPPVVLLDIQLPVVNGYEVCHALREELGRKVAIAFVSGMRTDPVDISSGLLVGADDYLVKPFDPSELLARVGGLVRRLTLGFGKEPSSRAKLTSRELEILHLLADGLDQRAIAHRLSISPKTVATHIEHSLTKLGVHSRAQAIAAAYRRELLHP
jgi:DNA-binding NarL/FixJ family response regulator